MFCGGAYLHATAPAPIFERHYLLFEAASVHKGSFLSSTLKILSCISNFMDKLLKSYYMEQGRKIHVFVRNQFQAEKGECQGNRKHRPRQVANRNELQCSKKTPDWRWKARLARMEMPH